MDNQTGRTVIADDSYLVKVRVDLAEFFGGFAFVVLREMPTKKLLKFREAFAPGIMEGASFFIDAMSDLIDDHSFYKVEGGRETQMTAAEVCAVLERKPAALLKVVQEYGDVVFFEMRPTDPGSAGSQEGSSEGA